MKIGHVVTELIHPNGQTDKHDEANSSFSNFANALKNELLKRAIQFAIFF